jgi:hypothetical protein
MKKLLYITFIVVFFISIIFTTILSTIGIETNKFNNFISKKISILNSSIDLKLTTVKFKLDIKEISLFLETIKPKISYVETEIATKNIKVYVDFISLLKSEPKIKKISLASDQLDINLIKKISTSLKPSNFTSFVNNKVTQGKLITEIEIYLNNNNILENFIAKGSVSNFNAKIINNFKLENTDFIFFADKSDILIKNIFGEVGPVKIKDGDLKIKISPEISLESNFMTDIIYINNLKKYFDLLKNFDYLKNIVNLEANLNNSFLINFDKTYKVIKYDYKINGKIKKANLRFKKDLKNILSDEKINEVFFRDLTIKTALNSEKKDTIISGKYSLNGVNFLNLNLENYIKGDLLKLNLNIKYDKSINLDFINYKKAEEKIADLNINLTKKKDIIKFNKINFTEDDNSIILEDFKFKNNKFSSFKKVIVKTKLNGKKNNDFSVSYGDKISINGNQFDATYLPKILNQNESKNILSTITDDIEINFENIIAPMSENLQNFRLIGKIEKGKFTKITSKGDFGDNNFLDITMKKNKNDNKKYLEIYSDLTRPLLTEYSFFKGLTGGKLLYSSIIDGEDSNSKLKIENFKVVNAPGVVKLLSLADLGGLADVAEGEGLSFDILEINIEKSKNLLKLNEILALGPSISVLMEGYQNPQVTSLRGTLIPAKTLNKLISKIPLIGNIIIPKEVGEGLFGVSFKMKGPPGKVKTTLNPIRTITPRFIQKIIDRNKNSK